MEKENSFRGVLFAPILAETMLKFCGIEVKLYMVVYGSQNDGRIQSVQTNNITFERVEMFKYLGKTLSNWNSFAEKLSAVWSLVILGAIRFRVFVFQVDTQK